MQLLNAIINGETNAKAQVYVPNGLKSTITGVKLKVTIHNHRFESVDFWWVGYDGNAQFIKTIEAGLSISQNSYGTHPSLITNIYGDLIAYFVPHTADIDFTVK